MNDLDTLRRLETSLRLVGAQGRERVAVGPFEAFFAASTHPYLSFATPHGDAPEGSAAVRALVDAFAARGRVARLEFLHELHPALAAALEAAGFERESAAPVMTLTRSALAPAPPEPGGTYARLQAAEPEALRHFLERQGVAYGDTSEEGALAWLPQLTDGLERGTVLGAGLWQGGAALSGATVQLGGEVGELAGVWTLPELRGQGLAFALCQRLLTDTFAEGTALCWLSAAEGAEGLYRRLGFQRVGTQLNYTFAGGER